MNSISRGFRERICFSLFFLCFAAGSVSAQPVTDQTPADANSTNEQIAALQLQLTNAWHQVEGIVCQPPPAFRRDDRYRIGIYPYWFHPGAIIPDFNRADVRQSQQLIYTNAWVSSYLTPTMMFHGNDLEFNAMTKLFYTNRDLPKKRLTEAEMVQINSLYRTIGHCQAEIGRLQPSPAAETTTDSEDDTNATTPPPAIAAIERIPQKTRILYGSIGIGTLLVLVVGLRLVAKKSG